MVGKTRCGIADGLPNSSHAPLPNRYEKNRTEVKFRRAAFYRALVNDSRQIRGGLGEGVGVGRHGAGDVFELGGWIGVKLGLIGGREDGEEVFADGDLPGAGLVAEARGEVDGVADGGEVAAGGG